MSSNDRMPLGVEQLTEQQRQIVDFDGTHARVLGPSISGKTTALLARATHLSERRERVLFVCAPSAREVARNTIVDRLRPTNAPIVVASWIDVAAAVISAAEPTIEAPRLISTDIEASIVASIVGLRADGLQVQRITRARRAYVESWLGREELLTHAGAVGASADWEEIDDLQQSFAAWCAEHHAVDRSGLLVRAGLLLRDSPSLVERWRETFPHILVDDYESATFAQHRLLTVMASPAVATDGSLVVAGNLDGPRWGGPANADWLASAHRRFSTQLDIALSPFREAVALDPVRVANRSLLGNAVVSEIIEALELGARHDDIAIVVNDSAAEKSIRSAARQQGIAIRTWQVIDDDPIAHACADAAEALALFRSTGEFVTGTAFPTVAALPPSTSMLGLDDDALRALTATHPRNVVAALWSRVARRVLGFTHEPSATALRSRPSLIGAAVEALQRHVVDAIDSGLEPIDALRHARTQSWRPPHGIEIVRDHETRGRSWENIIVCGFEEGSRPPQPRSIEKLDIEILDGPNVSSETERHQRAIIDSRRVVDHLCSRARSRCIALAAPTPGVLISRFLDDQPLRTSAVRFGPPRTMTPVEPTRNDRGFWEGQTVRASASSIDTFRNCPLEYTYKYVFGISTDAGPQALVGTITHDILERFFDPKNNDPENSDQQNGDPQNENGRHDRSAARLSTLFDERWNDDEFPYYAQAAEYRNTIQSMLDTVLEREMATPSDVVDVERSFRVHIGDYLLTGKIDRIDRYQSHRGNELRIIDYKTGNWTNDRAGEESLQLGVYALAARRDPDLAAIGEPSDLALYFLKVDKFAHQRVDDDHESFWLNEVAEAFQQIESGVSEASPTANCDYCQFDRVCPTRPRGRVVPVEGPRVRS